MTTGLSAIPISFFVIIFLLYKYNTSLSEGQHTMLKYGITGFSLVIGYMIVLSMNFMAENLGVVGLVSLTANLIYWYGTFMGLVFLYLMYYILFMIIDIRKWKKKEDPFQKTRDNYFK